MIDTWLLGRVLLATVLTITALSLVTRSLTRPARSALVSSQVIHLFVTQPSTAILPAMSAGT